MTDRGDRPAQALRRTVRGCLVDHDAIYPPPRSDACSRVNRGSRGPCAGAPGPDDPHDPSFRRRTATDLGRAAERSRHQSADVFQRSTTERSSTGAHCGQCSGLSFARACSDVRRVAAATRRAPGTAAVASLPSIRQTHLQLIATCRVVDARYRALGGSAGPVALRRDPSGPAFASPSVSTPHASPVALVLPGSFAPASVVGGVQRV